MQVTSEPRLAPGKGSVERFCSERVRQHEGAVLPVLSGYASYVEWCAANHQVPLTMSEFAAQLSRAFPDTYVAALGPSSAYVNLTIPARTDVPVALEPANQIPA